jgi:hypothetical protein
LFCHASAEETRQSQTAVLADLPLGDNRAAALQVAATWERVAATRERAAAMRELVAEISLISMEAAAFPLATRAPLQCHAARAARAVAQSAPRQRSAARPLQLAATQPNVAAACVKTINAALKRANKLPLRAGMLLSAAAAPARRGFARRWPEALAKYLRKRVVNLRNAVQPSAKMDSVQKRFTAKPTAMCAAPTVNAVAMSVRQMTAGWDDVCS